MTAGPLRRIPQAVRFAMTGGAVALVYLGGTLALHAAGFGMQIAIPTAYTASLVAHFTLQRYFVFGHREEFALGVRGQLGRYLVAAAVQYASTAALTAVLPGLLGVDERAIYLVVALSAAAVTYIVVSARVFHARS